MKKYLQFRFIFTPMAFPLNSYLNRFKEFSNLEPTNQRPAFENQTETLFLVGKVVWFDFSLWSSRIRVTIVTNHSGPCQTATRVSEIFHVIFDKQFACNCCCRLKLSFKRQIVGLWNLSLSIGRRSDNSMLIGCLHNFTH